MNHFKVIRKQSGKLIAHASGRGPKVTSDRPWVGEKLIWEGFAQTEREAFLNAAAEVNDDDVREELAELAGYGGA